MPRTPAENDRIRSATKAQILTTALRLFCDMGYYASSIGAIAKEAQISKGLLYHYFQSKEEVLEALVDLRINDVLVVMNAAATQPKPALQIEHIAAGALADKPDVFRFYLNLFSQPKADPIVAKYTQKLMNEQSRQFEVQTQMFCELGVANPRQRSLYFSATLQGVMLMYSTYPNGFPIDALKAQIVAEFCEKLS
jgi:AcrR family transcriptional regulator